eukprot:TRINITY_DN14425_c0_g1_i1.p1 TRINITY_DN14425_c0_g1~~TRINITY_DN14425_c0_g1_i1.p1  ORF type:complete len:180 (+),score=16.72 TRINITY_DN14425_c0_g1_i1:86-625(+)
MALHFFLLAFAAVTNAQSEPLAHISVFASNIVPAPFEAVWEFIGDFGNVTWMGGFILDSKIVQGSDNAPGCVRKVGFAEGRYSLEKLTTYQLEDNFVYYNSKSYSYEVQFITPGQFPGSLLNYKSTMLVKSITANNQTYMEWKSDFDTEQSQQANMTTGMYQGLLGGIQAAVDNFGGHK